MEYQFSLFAKGKQLRTDADFQNAIWFQKWVDIYRHGDLVEYGGVIETFDTESVTINGGYYLREKWQLIIR